MSSASARTATRCFRHRFDPKTYVERDQRISEIARLVPGDKVEVVSDEGPGSTLRYARTVHVFETPPPRPLSQGRVRAYRTPAERLAPISTLSFAGVVSRLNSDCVVLHTRAGGSRRFCCACASSRASSNRHVQGPTVRWYVTSTLKPLFAIPPKLIVCLPGGSGSIITQYPSETAGKTVVLGQFAPGTVAPAAWYRLSVAGKV